MERVQHIQRTGIYDRKQVCEILSISRPTFYAIVKKGYLRAARAGREYRVLGLEIVRFLL